MAAPAGSVPGVQPTDVTVQTGSDEPAGVTVRTEPVVSSVGGSFVGEEPVNGRVQGRRVVGYLQETIPPCVPLAGSDQDPCVRETPVNVAGLSVVSSAWPVWAFEGVNPPTVTDTMLIGSEFPEFTHHIVVRATGQAGTTRCDLYRIVLPSHTYVYGIGESLHHYFCFLDVRVNEYLVGTGPSVLTAEIHREVLFLDEAELADWPNWKDRWLTEVVNDPAARTAAAFEGKELVLFLSPAFTLSVEAWHTNGGTGDVWFVQRAAEDDIRAVAEDYTWAQTDDQRALLDVPLSQLVTEIKAAAVTRTERFGGRIGPDTELPMLVTDANRLKDFYIDVGAAYEGENATTVLPPPPPVPPGVPTNIAMSTVDGQILITWDEAESGGLVDNYWLRFESDLADGGRTVFPNSKSWQGEPRFEITYMMASFGSEFNVKVRASNSHGYSAWTEDHTFTTPTTSTTSSTTSTSA